MILIFTSLVTCVCSKAMMDWVTFTSNNVFIRSLIVRLKFDGEAKVCNADGSCDVPPEGAIRLRCGRHLYESYPGHSSDLHLHGDLEKRPFLFHLDNRMTNPKQSMVKSLFHQNDFAFAMVIENDWHYRILNRSGCEIQLLLPTQQSQSQIKILVNGSFPETSVFPVEYSSNPLTIDPFLLQAIKTNVKAFRHETFFNASKQCDFVPSSDDVFLDMEDKMTVSVGAMMENAISGALKPITAPIGGAIGTPVLGAVSKMVGVSLIGGLADQISLDLRRALPPQISEILVPSLVLSMTDSLTFKVSETLSKYLSDSLTRRIKASLTEKLEKEIGEAIPQIVGDSIPTKISIDLVKNVAPLLVRGLASSITSGTIQALGHSPLLDYYCYYCYHYETYCEFCHYAPQQDYYASYYAEYYSSYFSHYYTNFFKEQLESEFQQEEKQNVLYELKRNKYEIVAEL